MERFNKTLCKDNSHKRLEKRNDFGDNEAEFKKVIIFKKKE